MSVPATGKPMGRPTKLTPETQDRICNLIRAGHYFSTAAQASGVHKSTFQEWKTKGESAKAGKFREFWLAVKEAEGQSELLLVDKILKEGGAKGALEVLKRRFPERWGDRHRLEHSTPDGPLGMSHTGDMGLSVQVVIGDAADVWQDADVDELSADELEEMTGDA